MASKSSKAQIPESSPSQVLRAVIQRKGLTAYTVARMAGLSRPDSVHRWLTGERENINVSTFDSVCKALDLVLVERADTGPESA